jgi:hypothetical protein
MPWNDSDRAKIAQYLGYEFSQANLQVIGSAQQQLAANAGEVAIAMAQGHLRKLDELWEELQTAAPFAGASFISSPTGSKQYFRGERITQLRIQAITLVETLAQMLVIDIRRNPFALGGIAPVVRG